MDLSGVDPAWLWLGAGGLLAVTELAVPGVFLVWIAAAALLTGLATLIFGLSLPFQLVLFGLFSIASVLLGKQIYDRAPKVTDDPLLNDRAARLIGRTVTVVGSMSGGEGRVKVGDGIWSARGPDAPDGARVRITGIEGACLVVAPVEALLSKPSNEG